MKRFFLVCIFVGLVFGLAIVGCGKKESASSQEVIKSSQALKTTQEKADHLISQALILYASGKNKEAAEIARYVLSNIDSNSEAAKGLLEKTRGY